MLRRLRAHGPWDAPFTEATADQERVLLMHALAERHNQAGLHRGTGLTGFLDAIPYEPTVSFPKLPAEGKDHDKPGKTRQRQMTRRERTASADHLLSGRIRCSYRGMNYHGMIVV